MGTTPISTELANIKAALDAATASLTNIATGVTALDTLIQQLKAQIANSGSTLTAADQAALDAVATESTALATQAAAVNTAPPA